MDFYVDLFFHLITKNGIKGIQYLVLLIQVCKRLHS